MMKAVNAKEFDMVATWSVDRLGRSLTELLGILQGLHEKGVGLFLHQQGLDSSTTAGMAMFQMLRPARSQASDIDPHGVSTRRCGFSKPFVVLGVVKSLKLTVTGPGPPINLRSTTAVRCPDLAMCQARYSAERGFQGKTRAHMRGGYLEATHCSTRMHQRLLGL
jgi:hypothetical protein